MAQILFANVAKTVLAGPISATATTINVAAGSGTLFPQPGQGQYFKMSLKDAATQLVREIVHVTAVSGDTFTVVRGQESTTPNAYNGGDIAANLITAGTFAAFAQTANLPTNFVAGQDSGTANAVQVSTTTPAVSAPSNGQLFLITKGSSSNTGAVTFQIASGTQYSVVYKDGSALGAGDWPAGAAAVLYFNGGVMQFVACAGNPQVKTYFGRAGGTANAATVTTVPVMPALVDGHILTYVTGANPNTAAPTINPCGLGNVPIVRFDDSQPAAGDLPSYVAVPLQYDGGLQVYRLLWPVTPTQVPMIVPAGTSTTLYFGGANASDSNPGTQTAPFATLGALINYGTSRFSLAGGTLIAQMNTTGTYAMPTAINPGLGILLIRGVSGQAASSILTGTNVNNSANVQVSTVTMQCSSNASFVLSQGGGNFEVDASCTLVCNGSGGLNSGPGGATQVNGLTLRGNTTTPFSVNGGSIIFGAAQVTFSGTPVYSDAVIRVAAGTGIIVSGASFSGTVSGAQYDVSVNGTLQRGGVTIPGSAGVTSTGGQVI